jgi:hypothetical protein
MYKITALMKQENNEMKKEKHPLVSFIVMMTSQPAPRCLMTGCIRCYQRHLRNETGGAWRSY